MENQPQEMDVRKYLQIIHAKRKLFVLVTAVIIALITAASYVVPRSYEASATVSIEKNYLNVLMQDIAVAPSIEERGQALSVVMMSMGMLLRVLSNLKVEVGSKSEAEIEKIIKRFQTKTQINSVDELDRRCNSSQTHCCNKLPCCQSKPARRG